tara:strand:+ start:1912 stop:2232 length:321 start_codon:yes stop_codon:yes gene_type:complete
MPTLNIGLIIWAVAGPALFGGVTYLSMLAREAIIVSGATRTARNEEVSKCSEQRLEIARTINDVVGEGVADAVAAARQQSPTPSAPAALVALCNADPACRAREVKP